MKKNILITGAKGFIGSNLIKKLEKDNNFVIFQFNRDDSLDNLKSYIHEIDFIFHLAGEVRPTTSDEDMKKSNALLTKQIVEILEMKNMKIPLLMTSSIHAELLKNEYGRSKKEAEQYLQEYAKHSGMPLWIYRLPHVFGEGCKPNYNSAISTWIYNSINDLPITVFDRAIPMTYAYVQDIVDEIINHIANTVSTDSGNIYSPKILYQTTLGEIVDMLDEFKSFETHNDIVFIGENFKNKLHKTYRDYLDNKF
ncbi:NAD-dependent epimerase/dehydratase family protein [Sulfuricurvum sp.]|uniref:NAD-dependent epimerase/dehydratase family protein n=1 Tax=Sulfuricurvum sp. TaxID=2025608 RepID=UPI0026201894|nr:NAD-dependent epimerase/dehydratase family protein [Sulfuricurvum sp.]MDD4950723.1 NAD-dependent epimerase/dehydratase family protein [Sulfuricurvum sp.]